MRQKTLKLLGLLLLLQVAIVPVSQAMHVMEGYLSPKFCIMWGVLCLPFLWVGLRKLEAIRKQKPELMLLLAMMGAFALVLSALKIPSVTGSSSHPTGTGLGAILFGPWVMAVIGLVILIFQAVLLAHGGLSTLGANTFSMGIAGPFLSYGLYVLLKRSGISRKVAVFVGVALGNLFTYVVTSFQLALNFPSAQGGVMASAVKFLGVFALTQIPLAIIEGLLSVVIIMVLENYASDELRLAGYIEGGNQ